ncbi:MULTISPECIES: epimerase [unclassified Streptomyces]|uniref:epimerase n=1 Tax=unclassified Streptomyces TaxID=2593676 RepID=UPI0011CD7043|nr:MULTISPECIES: epimerase [unclassified Streptomyces]TXS74974.1 epimerase [Streptomyces sp. me109]
MTGTADGLDLGVGDAGDACHYAIGTSSAGVTETHRTRITRDCALAAAHTLPDAGTQPAFICVSGRKADSTERGFVMWARVRGAAHNAFLALPMRAHVLRPGYIRLLDDARASSAPARAFYAATSPLFPVLRRALPDRATSTTAIERAAIVLGRPENMESTIASSRDINRLAGM